MSLESTRSRYYKMACAPAAADQGAAAPAANGSPAQGDGQKASAPAKGGKGGGKSGGGKKAGKGGKGGKGGKASAGQEQVRERVYIDRIGDNQYGDLRLHNSAEPDLKRNFVPFERLNKSIAPTQLWLRARVDHVRGKGKNAFLLLRAGTRKVQATAFASDTIPRDMVKFLAKIPVESIVDIYGSLVESPTPITSATQQDVELQIERVIVISASGLLPFQLHDVADDIPDKERFLQDSGKSAKQRKLVTVSQATRLDARWVDLRVPVNQAIARLSSGVCSYYREFLLTQGFVEIHTPKLLGTASEGGAEVFHTDYFGRPACLAQSPQLFKQMCIAADLGRVFEVAPVFRAENSVTPRHLCEFMGLDLEMEIVHHYREVLAVLRDCFFHIFDSLNEKFAHEIDTVRETFPSDVFVHRLPEGKRRACDPQNPMLILKHSEAITALHALRPSVLAQCKKEYAEAVASGNIAKYFLDRPYVPIDAFIKFDENAAPMALDGAENTPEALEAWLANELATLLAGDAKAGFYAGLLEARVFGYGVGFGETGDFNTPNEKMLGHWVKQKWGVDFYAVDKYPLTARPFYTMPCPDNPAESNSYDFFMRGEEILSGAQRVHDPVLLASRAKAHGVEPHTIQDYIDSFSHGCAPHGGGGIGLERVVMLFCSLSSVKRVSLFPRTPDRITP